MTKRGAPPGNRNALKHGLYARRFSSEVKKNLLQWNLADFAAEVLALRVMVDILLGDALSPISDPDMRIKQMNAMAHATDSIVNAATRHMLFNSDDNPVLKAWFETIHEQVFFLDGHASG